MEIRGKLVESTGGETLPALEERNDSFTSHQKVAFIRVLFDIVPVQIGVARVWVDAWGLEE